MSDHNYASAFCKSCPQFRYYPGLMMLNFRNRPSSVEEHRLDRGSIVNWALEVLSWFSFLMVADPKNPSVYLKEMSTQK